MVECNCVVMVTSVEVRVGFLGSGSDAKYPSIRQEPSDTRCFRKANETLLDRCHGAYDESSMLAFRVYDH